MKFVPVMTNGLSWPEPATARSGVRLVIAGPEPMEKFAGAETELPVCTVTEAMPGVASNPVGRMALIEVAVDEFKVSVVGLPPGGVKRTMGVPPAVKLVPVRMRLKVGAFCSADAGLRLVIAGSTMKTSSAFEMEPASTRRTDAVPAFRTCAAPTLNDAVPVPTVSGWSVIAPVTGAVNRAMFAFKKFPETLNDCAPLPLSTVFGLIVDNTGTVT